MENTSHFLRRLCRFNDEVRSIMGRATAPSAAIQERFAACEEAERDLRVASERRDEAERNLRSAERLAEQARTEWREAEIDERIARAAAETQVWALIAQSGETTRFQWLWDVPAASARPASPAPSPINRFFSIARVHDDTYRFFTISNG